MIINYYFDEEAFDFRVDINNYFNLKECTPDKLMGIARDYWEDGMPSSEKKMYEEEYGITTIDDSVSADDIAEILANADEKWLENHLYDDIKNAFEDEARDVYDEMKAYQKDPYGYNGVSPSDFY